MLSWANRFNICCFLDNQQYASQYHSFELLLGVGSLRFFEPGEDVLDSLDSFIETNPDWIFGHFNYEAGELLEQSRTSYNFSDTSFPDCFLFVPEIVISLNEKILTIGVVKHDPSVVFADIVTQTVPSFIPSHTTFKTRINRQDYLENIHRLQEHIHHGDCYEINFCQEFHTTVDINPVATFAELIRISPNPFSAFYRVYNNCLLCASPERYLKKTGNKILSQPIKGTAPRNRSNAVQDDANKKQLRESAKERSENVMIVDLVRNDLSKICEKGSVIVDELFGVYPFPHVYQMISTVSGILKKKTPFSDILKASFPMGSMTGAPKKKVMELIKKYEAGQRGIYSGTVGFFTPEKDFDFNVVIRSLVYNEPSRYLSFHTGSAITALSDPEKEYEECLLKGKAMIDLFSKEA